MRGWEERVELPLDPAPHFVDGRKIPERLEGNIVVGNRPCSCRFRLRHTLIEIVTVAS